MDSDTRSRCWIRLSLISVILLAGFPVDAQINCNNAIPNCATCETSALCTSCSRFYGLYPINHNNVQCKECKTNAFCSECANLTRCTKCNDTIKYGPDLNGVGTCSPCIPNCRSCASAGGGKCNACNGGYSLRTTPSYLCMLCATNCANCVNNGTGKCDVCNTKFGLTSSMTCADCTANCQTCFKAGAGSCDAYSCATSYGNFYQSCLTPVCSVGTAGCSACSNTTTDGVSCTQCSSGYLLTAATSTAPGFCKAKPTDACTSAPCKNSGSCVAQGTDSYKCTCAPGFTGTNCDTIFKACTSGPCQNGGSCADQANAYTCTCVPGYTGGNCQSNIDECVSSPCKNGGSCKDMVNGYTCTCATGFSGPNCETVISTNACTSGPCQNSGSCVTQGTSYSCNCAPGYTGSNCQTNINECASVPCQNGGTCNDKVNGYDCTCGSGFSGPLCQTGVKACTSSPCLNGGSCTDQANAYTCMCVSGYSGVNCQSNIDECVSSPCKNGGSCKDKVNGYTCTCATGFSGPKCEAACATNCQNCSNAGATFCDNCMSGYILYQKKCAVGCTTGPTCQTCSADKINCADCTAGNTKTTSADGITTCTGPTKTIPDTNCTLPFTYKKQLYYSCIATTPGNYVCYGANRTWVNCQPTGANGAVYVAQNTTTSLTIAGYSSPTTVMSVNNWIVMQQRVSAAVSFNQSWVTYRNGFGQYDGNFWLGNEKIFQLTGAGGWRLRVEMLLSADRGWYSVEYNSFKVTNEADLYKLFLDGFSGDTGNSFMSPNINFQQNGMNFTTYDRKNDKTAVINNANFYQGGFWYKYDCDACLNSAYNKYIQWYQTPSGVTCDTCSIITVRMMIKKN